MGDRGAADILGRPLTPREAKEAAYILAVERAYYEKKRSKNQAEWAEKNKDKDKLLAGVIRTVYG